MASRHLRPTGTVMIDICLGGRTRQFRVLVGARCRTSNQARRAPREVTIRAAPQTSRSCAPPKLAMSRNLDMAIKCSQMGSRGSPRPASLHCHLDLPVGSGVLTPGKRSQIVFRISCAPPIGARELARRLALMLACLLHFVRNAGQDVRYG